MRDLKWRDSGVVNVYWTNIGQYLVLLKAKGFYRIHIFLVHLGYFDKGWIHLFQFDCFEQAEFAKRTVRDYFLIFRPGVDSVLRPLHQAFWVEYMLALSFSDFVSGHKVITTNAARCQVVVVFLHFLVKLLRSQLLYLVELLLLQFFLFCPLPCPLNIVMVTTFIHVLIRGSLFSLTCCPPCQLIPYVLPPDNENSNSTNWAKRTGSNYHQQGNAPSVCGKITLDFICLGPFIIGSRCRVRIRRVATRICCIDNSDILGNSAISGVG